MQINKALQKNTIYVTGFILISFVMKGCMAQYGNPYLFHPDEPYIYKDSFKLLYAVSEKDFGVITNPYNILLSIWYSLCFPIGKLFGLWSSYGDFKGQILSENFNIIYCGRILSFILSSAASLILYRYFSKDKSNRSKYLLVLIIFFNPVEWISDLWIKFDPICYLINVILLIKLFSYKEGKTSMIKMAIWLGLACAVRMDFFSYLIGFMLLMLFKVWPRLNLKQLFGFILIYGFTYLILTNTLLHWILNLFIEKSAEVQMDEGFVSVFLKKIQAMSIGNMLGNAASNFVFYLLVFVAVFLPLLLYDAFVLRFKAIKSKEFWLLQSFLLLVLLIFNFAAPHYILVTQICYLFFILKNYVEPSFSKLSRVVITFGVLYSVSLSVELFYFITLKKDTRIEAADYIYSKTKNSDLIAIEGYQNIGFVPVVSECSSDLTFKAEYVRLHKMGTGLTYDAKASKIESKCRKIIELETENRFGKDSIANTFINVYDTIELEESRPSLIVSKIDWKMDTHPFSAAFYKYVKRKASAVKVFDLQEVDVRMRLFQRECFNPGFIVYKVNY